MKSDAHDIASAIILVSPDLLRDDGCLHDVAGTRHKVMQKLELAHGEMKALAVLLY